METMRTKFIISATITLLGAVVSCNKKSLQEENIITPDHTYEYGVDHDAGGITRNTAFEYDWASQNKIELVTSYKKENDRIKVETIDVPLPWAWQSGPQQWLPQYAARNMSERDAAYWHLVFNLTGVDEKPGEHFFGLYNSKTGILRVFYYLTADRIPAHDGNDHMWQMGFTQDLVEHVAFQFALPYGEPVTDFYKRALGGNAAAYKTTALTEACSKQGKVVPAIGWWCYEVDMSPLREHNFFESDRSVMTPGMLVFHEDNVVLNSIMQGSLDGKMTGSINLESLAGAGTSTGGGQFWVAFLAE